MSNLFVDNRKLVGRIATNYKEFISQEKRQKSRNLQCMRELLAPMHNLALADDDEPRVAKVR
jgi:hypothetical protein